MYYVKFVDLLAHLHFPTQVLTSIQSSDGLESEVVGAH